MEKLPKMLLGLIVLSLSIAAATVSVAYYIGTKKIKAETVKSQAWFALAEEINQDKEMQKYIDSVGRYFTIMQDEECDSTGPGMCQVFIVTRVIDNSNYRNRTDYPIVWREPNITSQTILEQRRRAREGITEKLKKRYLLPYNKTYKP